MRRFPKLPLLQPRRLLHLHLHPANHRLQPLLQVGLVHHQLLHPLLLACAPPTLPLPPRRPRVRLHLRHRVLLLRPRVRLHLRPRVRLHLRPRVRPLLVPAVAALNVYKLLLASSWKRANLLAIVS